MMAFQEYIAGGIAVFCAFVVLREFVQPFLQNKGCGGCSGCAPKMENTLEIAPPRQ